MRQEVAHDKGGVIEDEVGGLAQGANHGAFLFGGLSGSVCGLAELSRQSATLCDTAFAPLTDFRCYTFILCMRRSAEEHV